MLLADGYIRNDRPVVDLHLGIKDIDHLFKFKEAINWSGNISKDNRLTLSSNRMVYDLGCNFGVVARKTAITRFSTDIPNNLVSHFIRGIFDGDGSISFSKNSVPIVNFIGTTSLITSIRDIIHYFVDISLRQSNKILPLIAINSNTYGPDQFKYISISGKNAFKTLKWLYNDSTIFIRLDRKYERYCKYFGIEDLL